jgi:hypothetical protein
MKAADQIGNQIFFGPETRESQGDCILAKLVRQPDHV